MKIICWLRGHRWSERPYPPRFGEQAWRYSAMPYLIDDPLVWKLMYEECERCSDFRWRFGSRPEWLRYWMALDSAFHPVTPSTVIPKGDARATDARLLREAQANPEASS